MAQEKLLFEFLLLLCVVLLLIIVVLLQRLLCVVVYRAVDNACVVVRCVALDRLGVVVLIVPNAVVRDVGVDLCDVGCGCDDAIFGCRGCGGAVFAIIECLNCGIILWRFCY